MRSLCTIAAILCSSTLFSQTSVIRVKSSHGALTEISHSVDRFGNPPINFDVQFQEPIEIAPVYDTLVLLNETCVIQKGWRFDKVNRIVDTLCDDAFEGEQKFIKDYYKGIYGDKITFVGFEKEESNIQYQNNPYFSKRTQKSSGKWVFVLLTLVGLGTYLIHPALNKKPNR